jgi:hypothetical protein
VRGEDPGVVNEDRWCAKGSVYLFRDSIYSVGIRDVAFEVSDVSICIFLSALHNNNNNKKDVTYTPSNSPATP